MDEEIRSKGNRDQEQGSKSKMDQEQNVVREIQSNENQVIGSENNTNILTIKFRTPNNLYMLHIFVYTPKLVLLNKVIVLF